MDKRIFSLETEYALMTEGRQPDASGNRLYDRLEAALRDVHEAVVCDPIGPRPSGRSAGLVEIKEGLFLDCGARLYYDTGHVEWACPECDNALDATVWDLAADQELAHAAQLAAERSPNASPEEDILVVKNNLDYSGRTTYGCHENYSLRRELSTLPVIERVLPAFLVTRSMFCGAGRIGASPEDPEHPVGFQLSQRADFMEKVVSRETRDHRAILNSRDEPLADENRYRRLHLILGDSNLSVWSTLMKLGTTGLVLDALEAGRLDVAPLLRDPVKAMHDVSRDLECRRRYPLAGGGMATAMEIQRHYWAAASGALGDASQDDPRRRLLDMWAKAMDDLETDPSRLGDRADWRIKYEFYNRQFLPRLQTSWEELQAWSSIVARTAELPPPPDPESTQQWLRSLLPRSEYAALQTFAADHQLVWRDYTRQRKNHFAVRAMDVRFHRLDRQQRIIFGCSDGKPLFGINAEAIETARRKPPRQTRAWLRGQVLRSPQRRHLLAMDWDRIHLANGRTVRLPDPFATREPLLEQIFGLSES